MCKFPLLAFLLFCSSLAGAQELRLNLYGAYAFDDKVDSYFSNSNFFRGRLNGGFIWGGGLEVPMRENYAVELLYHRLDSDAPITYSTSSTATNSKVFNYGVNYIMVAGNRYLRLAKNTIEPFGGLLVGAAIFSIKNPEPGGESTATRFSWGARLGTNIWLSPKVGIRLQGELLSAAQAIGGGAYFGSGGGGVALNTYSSLLQFNLGGAVLLRLSKKA